MPNPFLRMKASYRQLLLLLFLSGPLAAFAQSNPIASEQSSVLKLQTQAVANLLELIQQRLLIAPDVAQAKWNSGASIDDPKREALILEQVSSAAVKQGISPELAQHFFSAQFEASKRIQLALHQTWRDQHAPPFEHAPDLARDVRPKLDALTSKMLETLAKIQFPVDHAVMQHAINGGVFGSNTATAMLEAQTIALGGLLPIN